MSRKNIDSDISTAHSAEREIQRLNAENERLKSEVDALKLEIDSLRGKSGKHHMNKYQAAVKRSADAEYMFSRKNYLSFIISQLKRTSFFGIYSRIINVFRRYSFITTSLKIFSIIFLFFEASIFVLISTSAFVFFALFTLIASQIFTMFTIFSRNRYNKKHKKLLEGKNVCVFFPPKGRAFEQESFFCGMVQSLSRDDNSISVVVSPYSVNSLGLGGSKKTYFICREDGQNVLLVRRSYYFSLKKNVMEKQSIAVTEIY